MHSLLRIGPYTPKPILKHATANRATTSTHHTHHSPPKPKPTVTWRHPISTIYLIADNKMSLQGLIRTVLGALTTAFLFRTILLYGFRNGINARRGLANALIPTAFAAASALSTLLLSSVLVTVGTGALAYYVHQSTARFWRDYRVLAWFPNPFALLTGHVAGRTRRRILRGLAFVVVLILSHATYRMGYMAGAVFGTESLTLVYSLARYGVFAGADRLRQECWVALGGLMLMTVVYWWDQLAAWFNGPAKQAVKVKKDYKY